METRTQRPIPSNHRPDYSGYRGRAEPRANNIDQRKRRHTRSGVLAFFVTILLVWTGVLVAYTAYLVRVQSIQTVETVAEVETLNPFTAFLFFVSYLQPEYEAFHLRRPYLDYECVVWKVNAGLNRPFFTAAEVTTEAIPLLINAFNRLPYDFVPHELIPIDAAGRTATPETVIAFRTMQDSALSDGFNLVVTSAFRGIVSQEEIFERNGGLPFVYYNCQTYGRISIALLPLSVMPPGFSEHHTGRALDLMGADGALLDINAPSVMGRWVAENAHRYGFIVRYTEANSHITGVICEPWHITYVTRDIAMAMYLGEYGSLEEFVARNPDASL